MEVRNLKFYKIFYQKSVFTYILLISALVMLLYLLYRPRPVAKRMSSDDVTRPAGFPFNLLKREDNEPAPHIMVMDKKKKKKKEKKPRAAKESAGDDVV